MSSSDEEIVEYYYYRRYRARRNTRIWTHPYIERNFHTRLFIAAREHDQCDGKFLSFYRMKKNTYKTLVELITPKFNYVDTNMRECVPPEERLLITLRYLATGSTFSSLSVYFARGQSTVMYIVHETIEIIWEVLKNICMPIPTMEDFKKIAERYFTLWNLPNCVGALDGKHIRIEKFPGSGSTNFNYKHYHSIVLLASADADGFYTFIETGYAGRNSDGGIFRASAIRHFVNNGLLNFPPPSRFPDDEQNCLFPHYFVGDEAFPLSRYLMRPFPRRNLNNTRRVYNYRLSRARKSVECVFGMTTKKFQVLSSAIRVRKTETAVDIVKAVCILHNFVRKLEGAHYEVNDDEPQNRYQAVIQPARNLRIRPQSSPQDLRNYLANYFLTPRAVLPWQWRYCVEE